MYHSLWTPPKETHTHAQKLDRINDTVLCDKPQKDL